MKGAVAIFRKDVRQFWAQILIFLATLILFACEDPTYVRHDGDTVVGIEFLLYLILPFACWLLVTSLMQAEKTVGDEQYWLTRPFARRDLLSAKGLFLLAFVIVPVLVCQLAVLGVNGFSPGRYLGAMLVKQVFLLAWLVLPMAALATVTKNLGHAFLGALLLVLGFILGGSLLENIAPDSSWGGLNWILITGMAAIVLCTSTVVVLLQYTMRPAVLSRALMASGAAMLLLSAFVPPWQPAFAIQSWFSTRKIAPEAVRISFDAGGAVTRKSPDEFRFPIRVENVPEDLQLHPSWVSIESPWRSRWSTAAEYQQTAFGGKLLALKVPRADFDRLGNASIHIRGSLDLTLAEVFNFPTLGRCRDGRCFTPKPTNGFSPYPISPWFGPLERYPVNGDVPGVIAWPVAHIQRSFDLGPLRLADAAVNR
jgi:hypothetical protein